MCLCYGHEVVSRSSSYATVCRASLRRLNKRRPSFGEAFIASTKDASGDAPGGLPTTYGRPCRCQPRFRPSCDRLSEPRHLITIPSRREAYQNTKQRAGSASITAHTGRGHLSRSPREDIHYPAATSCLSLPPHTSSQSRTSRSGGKMRSSTRSGRRRTATRME